MVDLFGEKGEESERERERKERDKAKSPRESKRCKTSKPDVFVL